MDAEGTPTNHLDPRCKPMWRIQSAIVGVPLFIISLAVTGGLTFAGASPPRLALARNAVRPGIPSRTSFLLAVTGMVRVRTSLPWSRRGNNRTS